MLEAPGNSPDVAAGAGVGVAVAVGFDVGVAVGFDVGVAVGFDVGLRPDSTRGGYGGLDVGLAGLAASEEAGCLAPSWKDDVNPVVRCAPGIRREGGRAPVLVNAVVGRLSDQAVSLDARVNPRSVAA